MASIEELRERLNEPTTDDFVNAVIFESGVEEIPKKRAFMHRAFFALKKKFPEQEQLSGLIFDTSGPVPFSDTLDAILFRQEMAGMLPTPNPKYGCHIIRDTESFGCGDLPGNSFGKFDEAGQTAIKECAKEFSESVCNDLADSVAI